MCDYELCPCTHNSDDDDDSQYTTVIRNDEDGVRRQFCRYALEHCREDKSIRTCDMCEKPCYGIGFEWKERHDFICLECLDTKYDYPLGMHLYDAVKEAPCQMFTIFPHQEEGMLAVPGTTTKKCPTCGKDHPVFSDIWGKIRFYLSKEDYVGLYDTARLAAIFTGQLNSQQKQVGDMTVLDLMMDEFPAWVAACRDAYRYKKAQEDNADRDVAKRMFRSYVPTVTEQELEDIIPAKRIARRSADVLLETHNVKGFVRFLQRLDPIPVDPIKTATPGKFCLSNSV